MVRADGRERQAVRAAGHVRGVGSSPLRLRVRRYLWSVRPVELAWRGVRFFCSYALARAIATRISQEHKR